MLLYTWCVADPTALYARPVLHTLSLTLEVIIVFQSNPKRFSWNPCLLSSLSLKSSVRFTYRCRPQRTAVLSFALLSSQLTGICPLSWALCNPQALAFQRFWLGQLVFRTLCDVDFEQFYEKRSSGRCLYRGWSRVEVPGVQRQCIKLCESTFRVSAGEEAHCSESNGAFLSVRTVLLPNKTL